MTMTSETSTQTTTFFTGRDILAAENHLRQGTEVDALRIVEGIPAPVLDRLAAFVGANRSDLGSIVRRSRLPRSAR